MVGAVHLGAYLFIAFSIGLGLMGFVATNKTVHNHTVYIRGGIESRLPMPLTMIVLHVKCRKTAFR